MNATVKDVMSTYVVAVRDRLSYPPEPRLVQRTDMDLDF
jgi:hypothetical protein